MIYNPYAQVYIRPVSSRSEIRDFILFAERLYADCPYYCPPILSNEFLSFFIKNNPSLQVCDCQLFMAYKDNVPVGRIAAIINHKANLHWKQKNVRFGWMDFVDECDVSRALLDAVRQWGKERGMKGMNGPVGFTDWDHQGVLLEGFNYLAPLASLYNYPYYAEHLKKYGLKKENDWIEFRITPPKQIPDRLQRVCDIVRQRSKVHVDKVHSKSELERKYGTSYMDVLDLAYRHLYNFQPLTQEQKNYYNRQYFPILNLDFVTIVANEQNSIVGIGLGMPDISETVRKTHGRLLPFGWYHLRKALSAKHFPVLDLLLIGVLPEYQGKGIPALILADFIPYLNQYGVQAVETTAMMEKNNKVLSLFQNFQYVQHKRRRAYFMTI